MADVPAPAETPLYFESQTWPNGRRCVAYTDGHVKAVSSDDWQHHQPFLQLKLKKYGKPIKIVEQIPTNRVEPPKPSKKKGHGGQVN
jgi:hypothetical protein